VADHTVRKSFAQSQVHSAHVSLSVRQAQAASLRLEGRTYADIGRRLGISRERARQLVSTFRRVVDAYQDGQAKKGSRRARLAKRTAACELPAGKPVCLEHARFAGVNSVRRSTRRLAGRLDVSGNIGKVGVRKSSWHATR
jgi:DNA-binding CsgD family transcriptional regulator